MKTDAPAMLDQSDGCFKIIFVILLPLRFPFPFCTAQGLDSALLVFQMDMLGFIKPHSRTCVYLYICIQDFYSFRRAARKSQKMVFKMSLEEERPTKSTLSSVQSFSHVQLFATPWTAACQASLSISNSQSLSIKSVMLYNHLILC